MSDVDATATSSNEVYDALGNARRRYLLSLLQNHEVLALADLADELATWVHDAVLPAISAEVVTRIYISLHHNHVPKLADAGLVAYDHETELVRLADTGRRVDLDRLPTASAEPPV